MTEAQIARMQQLQNEHDTLNNAFAEKDDIPTAQAYIVWVHENMAELEALEMQLTPIQREERLKQLNLI